MYDILFVRSDGREYLCQNVTKIAFASQHGYVEISGEEILDHKFQVNKSYFLFSDICNYSISYEDICFIRVEKK